MQSNKAALQQSSPQEGERTQLGLDLFAVLAGMAWLCLWWCSPEAACTDTAVCKRKKPRWVTLTTFMLCGKYSLGFSCTTPLEILLMNVMGPTKHELETGRTVLFTQLFPYSNVSSYGRALKRNLVLKHWFFCIKCTKWSAYSSSSLSFLPLTIRLHCCYLASIASHHSSY